MRDEKKLSRSNTHPNIGIVANAPNKAAGEAFLDFLLSPEGQLVLLEPGIRRLPINPATYAKAPADYPNPFKDPTLGARVKFDVAVSEKRLRSGGWSRA